MYRTETAKANGKSRKYGTDSPRAMRVSKGHMPGMAPTRTVAAPAVSRQASADDLIRLGRASAWPRVS